MDYVERLFIYSSCLQQKLYDQNIMGDEVSEKEEAMKLLRRKGISFEILIAEIETMYG